MGADDVMVTSSQAPGYDTDNIKYDNITGWSAIGRFYTYGFINPDTEGNNISNVEIRDSFDIFTGVQWDQRAIFAWGYPGPGKKFTNIKFINTDFSGANDGISLAGWSGNVEFTDDIFATTGSFISGLDGSNPITNLTVNNLVMNGSQRYDATGAGLSISNVRIERIRNDPEYGIGGYIENGSSPELGKAYSELIVSRLSRLAESMTGWDEDTRSRFAAGERALVREQLKGWRSIGPWEFWRHIGDSDLMRYGELLVEGKFEQIAEAAAKIGGIIANGGSGHTE